MYLWPWQLIIYATVTWNVWYQMTRNKETARNHRKYLVKRYFFYSKNKCSISVHVPQNMAHIIKVFVTEGKMDTREKDNLYTPAFM